MYIHISSNDSLTAFPNNAWNDFAILLPNTLNLDSDNGQWECGLVELSIVENSKEIVPAELKNEVLCVFCNLVASEPIEGTLKPVLRRIYMRQMLKQTVVNFTSVQYVPVITTTVQSIRLYINHEQDTPISFNNALTRCTLHLRKTL